MSHIIEMIQCSYQVVLLIIRNTFLYFLEPRKGKHHQEYVTCGDNYSIGPWLGFVAMNIIQGQNEILGQYMEISFIGAELQNTEINIQPSLDYLRNDDPICSLPNPFLLFLIAILQGFSNLSNEKASDS